jgi:tripartite-type tricarboxylate transporter receptor subunit TctC
MIRSHLRGFGICLSAVLAMALADIAGARADTYPSRPVRLIVPFAAGGLNDVVARLVAPYLERALGQPFIIDNRPAASGIVGTDATAKATPDGYTLLMVASSFTVIPATHQKVPYDAQRDLAPIVMVAKNALLFLVNPKVPAKSLAEFVALAKADPGKFNYASPGAATQTHLVVELFSQRAGIKLQHIPYRGGAPAMTAMVAGDTQFTADPERRIARDRERKSYPRPAATRSADCGGARLPRLRGDPVDRAADHRRHAHRNHRAAQRRGEPRATRS